MKVALTSSVIVVLAAMVGCLSSRNSGALAPQRSPSTHLENLMRVGEGLYSGAQPKTDAAFQELKDLGVTVVVSVDGATPDVERAQRYGLRYVHVPIGYDGIAIDSARSFAQIARQIAAPIYVHCHHGKHRGPAATAVIAVEQGRCDAEVARSILETAGTSPKYAGLWRAVATHTSVKANDLPELVAVATVESMAVSMAKMDRVYDRLKLCEKAGWKSPPDHPDVVPAQEALILKEAFRESARLYDGSDKTFRQLLSNAEKEAGALEHALQASEPEAATAALKRVKQSCIGCHSNYRD